jgi:hypothetical protein
MICFKSLFKSLNFTNERVCLIDILGLNTKKEVLNEF